MYYVYTYFFFSNHAENTLFRSGFGPEIDWAVLI